jgi:gluconolactonase
MDVEVVAEGLQFPEGPLAMADGSVLLVEIRRQTLSRVTPTGRVEVVAELGGGPNGAAVGPDRAIYICNNGGFDWVTGPDGSVHTTGGRSPDYTSGSIQRVDLASGEVTTLYTECDGRGLNGPNDLVFDRFGGFWFSDPGKTTADTMQRGQLFYAKADGSFIRCVRDSMVTPNGVGLSPDQSKLYVAETLTSRLWAFDLTGPGEIAEPAGREDSCVLGPLPGYKMLDSLAVEAGGDICVGTLRVGGISVFHPAGGIEHVPTPDPMTTNICFGGADMRDAWITGSSTGSLYKRRWPRPGLKLNYNL